MSQPKTFPYLQALYFGFSKLIDNFQTIFLLALSWIAILGASVGILALSLKLCCPGTSEIHQDIVMLMIAPSKLFAVLKNLSLSTLGLFGSIAIGLWILYTEVHFYQLLRLSQSIYKANPLRVRDLFYISLKDFGRFILVRILFWFLPLMFILISRILVIKIPTRSPIILAIAPIVWLGVLLIFYIIATYYFTGYSLVTNTVHSIREDISFAARITHGYRWQMLFVLGMLFVPDNIIVHPVMRWAARLVFFSPLLALTSLHLYHSLKSTQLTQPTSSEK